MTSAGPLLRFFRELSLGVKLISSYLVILGVGGLAITVVGSWIVTSAIMSEARRTVKHDLAIARTVYQQELRAVRRTFEVAAVGSTVPDLLEAGDTVALVDYLRAVGEGDRLDFFSLASPEGEARIRAFSSEEGGVVGPAVTVDRALREGRAVAGFEVVEADRLAAENPALGPRATIPLTDTPRTEPAAERLTRGLVLTAAVPVRSPGGGVRAILYGGRLVNGNPELVDRVGSALYRTDDGGEGGGTVTVFLDDVRVATTVRTAAGERALGTRVSDEVHRAVLERGEAWNGRAFVVDAWYVTAYEPLRGVRGETVGMLYVGLPEASYVATRNRVVVSFLFIAGVGFLLVIGVTYLAIRRMTRPLGEMAEATRSIAAGDFGHEIAVDSGSDGDIARLAGSFNLMLQSLREMRGDLEEWGRTLEEKVRERSEELVRMQGRVAQSERLASIGMLAAGVAHEINNPLGGVLALTALTLEELPADDQNRENLEEVVRQTERCRDIVKHLLEFSRQTDVSVQELDLNRVVERTLALLHRQAFFFNVEVEMRLDPEIPHVPGDASQLQQVFMNILVNAVEAMEERGTLRISTLATDGGRFVEIRFEDTGRGIPPDVVGRIFDPFFTTGKDGRGTGLGLSIAYGIVARHQGTITVESEVGVGTAFVVRLPRAPATFEVPPPPVVALGVRDGESEVP